MRTIRFTHYRFIAVGLSLFCMIFGLLFTVFYHHGLNMGVDFCWRLMKRRFRKSPTGTR